MKNPYAELPRDKGDEIMQEFVVPRVAASAIGTENGSASSVITLTDSTTTIEIAAFGSPAVAKWIAVGDATASVTAAGGGNYDIIIPVNGVRRLAVPQEVIPTASAQSSGGSNSRNGLYRRLAYKSHGVGSILTVQYPS